MKSENVRTIAVVGAGAMGHAIAQEFARVGYHVNLYDVTEDALAHALENVKANLELMVDAGLATAEEASATPGRIRTSTDLASAISNADVVLEVAPEDVPLKQELFGKLDALCPERTILASSSSTIMPSVLGAATKRPDRVVIAHYMMPPYIMPLVEIVRGPETSDETVQAMCDLLQKQGRMPVVLRKEVPGFLVNRLQTAVLREAFSLLQQGVVGAGDIDRAFTGALGPRWAAAGPFELMNIQAPKGWLNVLRRLLPVIESSTTAPRLLEQKVADIESGATRDTGFLPSQPGAAEALRRRIAEAFAKLR
jgi:3-hydroxybutyryl-CoA dehydrogenase